MLPLGIDGFRNVPSTVAEWTQRRTALAPWLGFKQSDVPLDYGAEYPNPIPNHGTGGYPITLQFPPFDKVTGVSAKLTDVTGNPVEFFLSDPEHPATSFGQFGVICLIPKQLLQAQHAYTVRINASWKGKPDTWTWSFSTSATQGRSVR